MHKPPWLNDELKIHQLLEGFASRFAKNIDQDTDQDTERRKPLRKTLKTNFLSEDEKGSQSWALLQKLVPELITIKLSSKRNPFEPEWSRAIVYCAYENKAWLYDWLDFKIDDSLLNWQRDIDDYGLSDQTQSDDLNIEFLKSNPIYFSHKSNHEVIARLVGISKNDNASATLREISAKHFWGDSKFLDGKYDWLIAVLPERTVVERKIQVNFYLPKSYDQVLLVENLDTYHQLIQKRPAQIENFAIVYASGFRLSASRIRNKDAISLHHDLQGNGNTDRFVAWWLGHDSVSLACYFWGDLDYAAMAILKSLRINFKNMQLWQAGYQAMQQAILNGNGHPFSLRDKSAQHDPVQTGCQYADDVILPLLRKHQRCFDQEGIDLVAG